MQAAENPQVHSALASDLLSNADYSSTIILPGEEKEDPSQLNQSQENQAFVPADKEAYKKAMRKQFWLNVLKIAIVSLCKLSFGYYMVVFNPLSGTVFRNVYGFSEEEIKRHEGDVNMYFYIGAAGFGLVGGWLADRLGRRRLIICLDLCIIVTLLGYWVENIIVLKIVRFFNGGLGACSYMVATVFISEIFPKSISGVANVAMFAFSTATIFLGLDIPGMFSDEVIEEHYRYFLVWPVPIFILKAILMIILFKNDSPRWLVKKLKAPDHLEPDSEESNNHLKDQLADLYKDTYRHSQVHKIVDSTFKMHTQTQEGGMKKASFRALCSKTYRAQMVAAVILSVAGQYNGISYFTLYSKEVFDRTSNNGKEVTNYFGLSKLFGGVVAIIFAKSFGRKFNLLFGALLQALSLVLILIDFETGYTVFSYIGVVAFGFGFAIGLGGGRMSYLPEIIPSVGVSLSVFITNGLTALNSRLLPEVAPAVGDRKVVIFFLMCCLLSAVLVDATTLETKGKQEVQITKEYQERKCKSFQYK